MIYLIAVIKKNHAGHNNHKEITVPLVPMLRVGTQAQTIRVRLIPRRRTYGIVTIIGIAE